MPKMLAMKKVAIFRRSVAAAFYNKGKRHPPRAVEGVRWGGVSVSVFHGLSQETVQHR